MSNPPSEETCKCRMTIIDGERVILANDDCFFHGLRRLEGVDPMAPHEPDDPGPPPGTEDDKWDDATQRQYIPSPTLCVEFDVTPRTIRNWLRDGKLKGRKINGRWYITRESARARAKELFGE